MKNIVIIVLILIYIQPISASPLSNSNQSISIDAGFNHFTRGDILTSYLWYSTIMPEYRIHYYFNLLDSNNGLHRIACSIGYFESNSFTFNSSPLDSGEMRILFLDLYLEYLRYLPITSFVSFITGGIIEPEYMHFSEVVAPGQAKAINNVDIKISSLFGFSFYSLDFMEFAILSGPVIGLPVYGSFEYPGKSNEETSSLAAGGTINLQLNFYLNSFIIGLDYKYRLLYSINMKKDLSDTLPRDVSINNSHSLMVKIGFMF